MPEHSDDPLERLAPEFRLRVILEAFNNNGVQYVIIGGMAAVLHGAEVSTVDVDMVLEQSRANRDRAIEALLSLGAERITYTREMVGPGEEIPESGEGLVEAVECFRTREGRVDLLREADVIGGYSDLSEKAEVFFVDDQDVHVADLDSIIAAKEASSEDKDRRQLRSLYDLRDALEREEAAELLAEAREPHEGVAAPDRMAEINANIERARRALVALETEREELERDQPAPHHEPRPDVGYDH